MLEAKQKRAQLARKRILAAAEKLFTEQGFDNTGTEEIAKEAEVAKGSVFAHFGDKLHLLAEIGLTEMRQRLGYLENQANAKGAPKKPVDVICRGLNTILDYFEQQPEFLRLFVEKSALSKGEDGKGFNEVIGRVHNALQEIIRRSVEQKIIPDCNSSLKATAVRSFMLHMAVGRMCGEYPDEKSRKSELRELVKMALVSQSVDDCFCI